MKIGIAFHTINDRTDGISLAPITLFPSPFPQKDFLLAKQLQPIINRLSHNIAYNQQFLTQSLKKTIEVDDFTNKLFQIYNQVMREGLAQNISLGLFRADYMMNESNDGNYDLKQVEVNNISASFGGLAPYMRQLHKHILSKYSDIQDLDKHLPLNPSSKQLANGLIKAFDIYSQPNAVILVVVESFTVNIFDQRVLEFTISELRPDIKIIRKSFNDLRNNSKLNGNKQLIICDKYEVAVIYYRTAYAPQDFAGEEDWNLRLLLEQSMAIKCPSIQYHLAGCKKIQQILANRVVLEKFIPNEKDVNDLMQVFAGLWSLESGQSGDTAIDMALREPQKFVLKPQREGGGNNYFGSDAFNKLNQIKNSRDRDSYILMEFIKQPKVPNYILVPNRSLSENKFKPSNILCELGIFGAIIADQNEVMLNCEAGHLVRSKVFGTNEGGVAAGFGALDSPFLF